MHIFILNAGGYYAIGSATIAAPDVDTAAELANAATDSTYELAYHPFGGNSVEPVGTTDGEPVGTTDGEPRVLNIKEWGMPHLPSKGSGVKVTF